MWCKLANGTMATVFGICMSVLWVGVLVETTTTFTPNRETSTDDMATTLNALMASFVEISPTGSDTTTSFVDVSTYSGAGGTASSTGTSSAGNGNIAPLTETSTLGKSEIASFPDTSPASSREISVTGTTPPVEHTESQRINSEREQTTITGDFTASVSHFTPDAVTSTEYKSSTVSRVISARTTPSKVSSVDSPEGLPSWAYVTFIVASLIIFVPLVTYGVMRCKNESYRKQPNMADMKRKQLSTDSLNVITVKNATGYDENSVATYKPEVDYPTFTMAGPGVARRLSSPNNNYYKRPDGGFSLSDFYTFNRAPFRSLAGRSMHDVDPTRANYVKLN